MMTIKRRALFNNNELLSKASGRLNHLGKHHNEWESLWAPPYNLKMVLVPFESHSNHSALRTNYSLKVFYTSNYSNLIADKLQPDVFPNLYNLNVFCSDTSELFLRMYKIMIQRNSLQRMREAKLYPLHITREHNHLCYFYHKTLRATISSSKAFCQHHIICTDNTRNKGKVNHTKLGHKRPSE